MAAAKQTSKRTDNDQPPEARTNRSYKHKQSPARPLWPTSPLGTKGRRRRHPCLRGKPAPHRHSSGPCPAASGLQTAAVPVHTTKARSLNRLGWRAGRGGRGKPTLCQESEDMHRSVSVRHVVNSDYCNTFCLCVRRCSLYSCCLRQTDNATRRSNPPSTCVFRPNARSFQHTPLYSGSFYE